MSYKNTKKFLIIIITIFQSSMVFAQSNNDVDFMRSTGKIYSVVAAIVLIFLGIVYYLYRIDTKLTKLEKHIKDEHKTS